MHGACLKRNVFGVDKGEYLFKGLEVYSHSASNYPWMDLVQHASTISPHLSEVRLETIQTPWLWTTCWYDFEIKNKK